MKKLIFALIALVVIVIGYGFYLYFKPHPDIAKMDADHRVNARALFSEYSTQEAEANAKYLDKILEVTGIVASMSEGGMRSPSLTFETDDLMYGVICEFDSNYIHQLDGVSVGDQVTVKGKCAGKLMDVVLMRCALANTVTEE